jgi:hypothetical protein
MFSLLGYFFQGHQKVAQMSKIRPIRSHWVPNTLAYYVEAASLEASQINITLDGCTYPGQKLAQFILSEKNYSVNKTLLLKTGKGAGIWGRSHKTFLE